MYAFATGQRVVDKAAGEHRYDMQVLGWKGHGDTLEYGIGMMVGDQVVAEHFVKADQLLDMQPDFKLGEQLTYSTPEGSKHIVVVGRTRETTLFQIVQPGEEAPAELDESQPVYSVDTISLEQMQHNKIADKHKYEVRRAANEGGHEYGRSREVVARRLNGELAYDWRILERTPDEEADGEYTMVRARDAERTPQRLGRKELEQLSAEDRAAWETQTLTKEELDTTQPLFGPGQEVWVYGLDGKRAKRKVQLQTQNGSVELEPLDAARQPHGRLPLPDAYSAAELLQMQERPQDFKRPRQGPVQRLRAGVQRAREAANRRLDELGKRWSNRSDEDRAIVTRTDDERRR
jgi:hypothetical protein